MPVEHQAVTPGISRVDQLAGLELAQDALGNLPWRLLELDERGGVEAGIANAVGEAEERRRRPLSPRAGAARCPCPPEFEMAWSLGGELDEASPDAAAYDAALDELQQVQLRARQKRQIWQGERVHGCRQSARRTPDR